jgi:hypothetical protein
VLGGTKELPKMIRKVVLLVACYLMAWLLAFLWLIGFEPHLIPMYFRLGWTFHGLELVSFVWLFSWLIFASMLLVYWLVRWGMSVNRARAA